MNTSLPAGSQSSTKVRRIGIAVEPTTLLRIELFEIDEYETYQYLEQTSTVLIKTTRETGGMQPWRYCDTHETVEVINDHGEPIQCIIQP